MSETLTIPSPEFEKGCLVWLSFSGAIIPTRIKIRAYDPDKACWHYRVALSGHWHKASELDHRYAEFDADAQTADVGGQANG